MTSLTGNLEQIFVLASKYKLPLINKAAIIREYLQSKVIEIIYQQRLSKQLFFVGGTSLRLLRDLDRFSEDLDFDFRQLSLAEIDQLMETITKRLIKENLPVELYRNQTERRIYYELRFSQLWHEAGLSPYKEAKLRIKFDFKSFWQGQTLETVLFNRWGFLTQVVTPPLDQVLVQKLYAYFQRKQTLARDMYDVTWLYAKGARLDKTFLKVNELSDNLADQALAKWESEKSQSNEWERQLKPFLIYPENAQKIKLLGSVLESLNQLK